MQSKVRMMILFQHASQGHEPQQGQFSLLYLSVCDLNIAVCYFYLSNNKLPVEQKVKDLMSFSKIHFYLISESCWLFLQHFDWITNI